MIKFRQPDGRQVFMDTEEEIRDIRKEIWSAQQVEKVRKTAFKTELGELLNKLKEDSKKEAENGDGKKEPTRDLRGGKASTEADIADCHSKNKRAEDEHQNEIEKCNVEITKLKLKFQSHYLGDDRFFRRYKIRYLKIFLVLQLLIPNLIQIIYIELIFYNFFYKPKHVAHHACYNQK